MKKSKFAENNHTIELEVTLLGTGTSQGVPVIGCRCRVCTSADERDKRLRTAALIRAGGKTVAIDCGPDFRQQMLRQRVDALDAILLTHEHNDHIIGMDDVRPFNFMNWADMPVFCSRRVGIELQKRFAYIFATESRYPGAPMIRLDYISKEEPFSAAGLPFVPIELMHGNMPVLGFRLGAFAYLTDVRSIEAKEMDKLRGVRYLVLSALQKKVHHSHFNLEQALDIIGRISPDFAFLTHISHRMGKYEEVQKELPKNVILGYDGLTIQVK